MSYISLYSTPSEFDDIILVADGEYLTGLYFISSQGGEKHLKDRQEADLSVFQDTRRWLDCYFSGHQPNFTPRYRLDNATSFRKEVSEIMCTIPYGKTVTYGEIATQIAERHGLERMSAQAVGGAVGWNPICIIIPCHRVMGANGKLTGYGGGINNKIALLQHEGIFEIF